MRIVTFTLGALKTNCYLLIHQDQAVAVDAGENPAPMLELLRKEGLTLTHILLTHLHADHVGGVHELQQGVRDMGAPLPETWGSAQDAYLRNLLQGRGGAGNYPKVPPFDFIHLEPGKRTILEQPMLALDTPGHTPGGLSFYFPRAGAVFVGDLLFRDSVGRTDWQGGDAAALMRSIEKRIFILPEATTVYPGHGPTTTVGREKAENPFFR